MSNNKRNSLRTPDGAICLLIVLLIFGYMSWKMGLTNMLNTMMATAYDLLMKTVFYLMAVCVLTGALSKIFIEFGVVKLLEKVLRPLMRPLYNLPGTASLGAVLTFLSDNPAIMTLAKDKRFASYFKKYQFISFCNFGTAFGMGLIVVVFMISKGWYWQPFIGIIGAACGGIVATRMMQHFVLKAHPEYRNENVNDNLNPNLNDNPEAEDSTKEQNNATTKQQNSEDSLFLRILNSCLDGGRDGVNIGLAIIPGVLIITTFVIMITNGADLESGLYTGGAKEGVGLLPWLASKVDFLFQWLFGFEDSRFVAFPITALGAVGAALSLVDQFKDTIDGNAIAVFTAMGMCWSGFLSTHTAMLDTIGYRHLTAKDIISQICGGLAAGIVAHWLFVACAGIGTWLAPAPLWSVEAQAWNDATTESIPVRLTAFDNGTYRIDNWYKTEGTDLEFSVAPDSSINIENAYDKIQDKYYLVRVNPDAEVGKTAYAVHYTSDGYSFFEGDLMKGYMYSFVFVYDINRKELNRCFYEITWGGQPRMTVEAETKLEESLAASRSLSTDSTTVVE